MKQSCAYYIYIKTSENHLHFDVGLVDNIVKILDEQKQQIQRLRVSNVNKEVGWKLIYYEHGHTLESATLRCQKLRRLPPSKRLALIERHNPGWNDLSAGWLRERG